jgi:hypothetical protein
MKEYYSSLHKFLSSHFPAQIHKLEAIKGNDVEVIKMYNKYKQLAKDKLQERETINEVKEMTFGAYLDDLDNRFVDLMKAAKGLNAEGSQEIDMRATINQNFTLFRNYISALKKEYSNELNKELTFSINEPVDITLEEASTDYAKRRKNEKDSDYPKAYKKDPNYSASKDKSDTEYAVMLTGGSIGDKPRPRDAKGYVGLSIGDEEVYTLDKAKEKAKRMNKALSPGEKSYYNLKYVVVPVANGKFIKESLNEREYSDEERTYWHVIEDVDGEKGWQGFYNTKEEAKNRANSLQDMFPESFFYVEASNSEEEPVDITLEEASTDYAKRRKNEKDSDYPKAYKKDPNYSASKDKSDAEAKRLNALQSVNEAKATCCHRCGRVHVKGTPCEEPYLKGKDSCAINEIKTLKEFYNK